VIALYEYIVQSGDTLLKIAESYGMSADFIISANKELLKQPLFVGQKIVIPIRRYLEQCQNMRRYWSGSK
jgi:LysM repeat protein